jgi:hypothetical protein
MRSAAPVKNRAADCGTVKFVANTRKSNSMTVAYATARADVPVKMGVAKGRKRLFDASLS